MLAHATALARQLQEADEKNLALARRVEAAEQQQHADSRRLDALEAHLKHERHWRDTVLMYDYQDGCWLAHAERGTLRGCQPMENKGAHPSLRAALDAAFGLAGEGVGRGE